MSSKPSTKPSWTTNYSKSNMPSQEPYQQPKESSQSEWSALESQKDTAAELKQKTATAAQIEIPEDVVDKEAYRHSQDYYANMCQSVFATAFDNPPEGLSEDDIRTATIDVLVDESQKFIADGGKMSGDLDEILFPDQDQTSLPPKKLFKQYECYKPKHAGDKDEVTNESLAQGGLGGIGTENWILQNGGSFTAATRSFLQAAGLLGQNGQRISGAEPTRFTDFVNNYQIWDLGANHTSERKSRYPHDNFIANNLDETGYQKITKALLDYLGV